MIIYGYFLDDLPKDFKSTGYNIHKLTGLTILTLMLLRLGWALLNPKPVLPFNTPSWQKQGERLVHFLLYITVIAMPVVGWIGSVASGHAPHIASIQLELPLEQSKAIADTAFFLHDKLAIAIIVLVSIHALAALYHHFIKRDNILRRMMPHCR
jgi:cytochrome b561